MNCEKIRIIVTGAAVQAAIDAFNAFPCLNPGSIVRTWNEEQMRATLEAALCGSTAVALTDDATALLAAVDAEMGEEWKCNSYHPMLRPAAERLRARLTANMAAPAPQPPANGASEPTGPNWRFMANEWADVATNGLQHLRNLAEGIGTVAAALSNMEECVSRVMAQQAALTTVPEPLAAPRSGPQPGEPGFDAIEYVFSRARAAKEAAQEPAPAAAPKDAQ